MTLARSTVGIAQTQSTDLGPSFACDKATSLSEKLICSDRELSSLDLEYSRLYRDRLQEPDRAEVAEIRSNAQSFLQFRDRCADESLGARSLRASEIDCLVQWYHGRIAELSDLPTSAPREWSPRLVAQANVHVDRHRGLFRVRSKKPIPEIYFKAPGVAKFFKMRGEDGAPQPARVDRSISYAVYQDVLGSLTYVRQFLNDGHLDVDYFFNKDGRLAAVERRFDTMSNGGVYVEYETVFYDAAGRETRRTQRAFYGGKLTVIRKELSLPRLQKPLETSWAAFSSARFRAAESLDPTRLGLCHIDVRDGYGQSARILNFAAEPLEVYERSIQRISYRSIDNLADQPVKVRGMSEAVGTLGGKRVYSVTYPTGLVVVLVERQTGRFLPVLYVSPEMEIDHLEVANVDGEEVLYYSSRISGTGGFTSEWYLILDRGVPRNVEYRTVLMAELKKLLPENYGVWKGGGFDLKTLTFSHGVWKDGDANCCPSGGSVEIVLGFEKGRFFVKSSHWEKPDETTAQPR